MLTEEAVKRCKELIKPVHSNWIGLTNQKAIEMILDIIEKYKNSDYETICLENSHLKEELEKLQDENKKYIVQLTDEEYRNLVDAIRREIKQEYEQKIMKKIKEILV